MTNVSSVLDSYFLLSNKEISCYQSCLIVFLSRSNAIVVVSLYFFPWKPLWNHKAPPHMAFLHGKVLGATFLAWTIWERKGTSLLIGACSTSLTMNPGTIFFYGVLREEYYGIQLSASWVFRGLWGDQFNQNSGTPRHEVVILERSEEEVYLSHSSFRLLFHLEGSEQEIFEGNQVEFCFCERFSFSLYFFKGYSLFSGEDPRDIIDFCQIPLFRFILVPLSIKY